MSQFLCQFQLRNCREVGGDQINLLMWLLCEMHGFVGLQLVCQWVWVLIGHFGLCAGKRDKCLWRICMQLVVFFLERWGWIRRWCCCWLCCCLVWQGWWRCWWSPRWCLFLGVWPRVWLLSRCCLVGDVLGLFEDFGGKVRCGKGSEESPSMMEMFLLLMTAMEFVVCRWVMADL